MLSGALRVISRDQPLVLTEFSPSQVNRTVDLFDVIDPLGYRLYGYARPRLGGQPNPSCFGRLESMDLGRWGFKMFFLTSQRLWSKFDAIAPP